MLSIIVSSVLGFSGVTPSRKGPPPTAHTDAGVGRLAVEVTPISFPKLNLEHLHGLENEYQLNMGKAIDSIRRDYPLLLTHEPDLSIFTEDIQLFDSSGKRLSGLSQYSRIFSALRFVRRAAMSDSEVTYRLVVSDGTIRVRWCAKLWMRSVLPGLGSEPPMVQLDGVSVYELDDEGMVRLHKLESIILTPSVEQPSPVSLTFAWPHADLAVPELARPFFRAVNAAAEGHAREGLVVEGLAVEAVAEHSAGAWSTRRAPPPQASASDDAGRETPMERAARERGEMAQEAQQRQELRTRDEKKSSTFGGFSISVRPRPRSPLRCSLLVVPTLPAPFVVPAHPAPFVVLAHPAVRACRSPRHRRRSHARLITTASRPWCAATSSSPPCAAAPA